MRRSGCSRPTITAEWAGFECDHANVPTKSQRRDFLRHYVTSFYDNVICENENLAVEVGIFKYTHTNNEGVAKNYFGRFHVVLRKEEGTWKILVDTDSSEGNTISEKDFLAASPME